MEKESKFEGIIPPEIIDSLKSNKCILFVGSGLSSKVTRSNMRRLPNWEKFLTELLDYAILKKVEFWDDPEFIRDMIKKGNFIMAAQELQDRVGVSIMGKFLNSIFRDKLVLPSETHRLLPHIPFRAILTTNYDSLIEGAYSIEEEGRLPMVFTQEDLVERHQILQRDDFFIFKLHGHFDRPSTIVLGSRDYQDLLFRTPGYKQFIETLFSTHTVIFVGFSGDDPDLNNILDKLASIYSRTLEKHYILLPSGTMNPIERRRFALDKRLEVLEYKKDINHTQVTEFLRELTIQVNREEDEIKPYPDSEQDKIKVFISGSFQDIKLLRRIAEFLRQNGYSPWLAEEQIKSGTILTQKISEAIENSDCMIIVSSENSIKSEWVRKESEQAIIRALDGKMNIIPIVIDDVEPPKYLSNIQYLRLNKDFNDVQLSPLNRSLSQIKKTRSRKNRKKCAMYF